MSNQRQSSRANMASTRNAPEIEATGSRRNVLVGAAGALLASTLPRRVLAATSDKYQPFSHASTFMTRDGTQIFYKDWGTGQPVVLSHCWPLSADAWDSQMLFFATHGYRVIAHDRRGHGRSSQPWGGNDLNTYADDLAALVEKLDLRHAIHIGHSLGGSEVVKYIGRYGTRRVAKAVLIAATAPLMLKTEANTAGVPIKAFDDIRAGILADRSTFLKNISMPFYGFNRPNAKISEGLRDGFWVQGMQASYKAVFDGIKLASETDLTADLQKFDVPTLLMHGDDDQLVPIDLTSRRSARLIKGAVLKVYPGAPHGLVQTMHDEINADLLAFIQSS